MVLWKIKGGNVGGMRRASVRRAVEVISGGRVGDRVWYAWTCCTLGSGLF